MRRSPSTIGSALLGSTAMPRLLRVAISFSIVMTDVPASPIWGVNYFATGPPSGELMSILDIQT
jgi:hypothetical protein